jgi:SAM-dependent methyltransferase
MQDHTERGRLQRERAFFEERAAAGMEQSWAEGTPVAARRRQRRAAMLLAAAPLPAAADARILDVGCGSAAYTVPFALGTEATVVGADLTPAVLRLARDHVPRNVRLLAAEAGCLPFPDATFDAVVGNAILHHLPLQEVVPELLRVLKPGGPFCFAEPNLLNPHLLIALNVPALRRRLGGTPDETAFVRWRLKRDLERFGLVGVSVRPFDFLYPLTPRAMIPVVDRVGRVLERVPVLREIAGSLLISARKPN